MSIRFTCRRWSRPDRFAMDLSRSRGIDAGREGAG